MFLFQSNNGGGGFFSLLLNIIIIAIVVTLIISLIIFFLPVILLFWLIAKIFGKQPPISINNIKDQYQRMNNKNSSTGQNRQQHQGSAVDDIIDVSATDVSDKS